MSTKGIGTPEARKMDVQNVAGFTEVGGGDQWTTGPASDKLVAELVTGLNVFDQDDDQTAEKSSWESNAPNPFKISRYDTKECITLALIALSKTSSPNYVDAIGHRFSESHM